VRHRLHRAARAAPLVLAAGCAVSITTFLGGVALADPPPPSPSPSSTPEPSASPTTTPSRYYGLDQESRVHLSVNQGLPGTTFTATAEAFYPCDSVSFQWDDPVVVEPAPQDNAYVGRFEWTTTVPAQAGAGTHQVTASCNGVTKSATFTVTEKPSLTLSPEQGTPGQTGVTATTKGFEACLGGGSSVSQTMSWQWDGAPLQTSVASGDGSTVTFEVPADASPDDAHTVTAACGEASAKAPFAVTPIAKPALTLDKPQGLRGSPLTANGTGFACGDDRVQLLWDGKTPLGDGASGTFSAQLTIPADASISQHTVVASCRKHADISDSQSFTVTNDTVGFAVPAALTLAPARGAPGDPVHVTGDRFACTDSRTVQLSWDGQPLANPSADASGHFDTSISVPANAQVSSHIVRASCAAGSAVATAGFAVVVAGTIPPTNPKTIPPPPPPPLPGVGGWVLLLIVGVLAVLAYRHWRKPRNKPQPNPRVYATVSPTSGLPLVSTSETPAHGEVTHALRLQVHADLGAQTVSEVDSDDTT
jgi:hypothetical protein